MPNTRYLWRDLRRHIQQWKHAEHAPTCLPGVVSEPVNTDVQNRLSSRLDRAEGVRIKRRRFWDEKMAAVYRTALSAWVEGSRSVPAARRCLLFGLTVYYAAVLVAMYTWVFPRSYAFVQSLLAYV